MIKFELKPLPYAYDALQPVISKRILELHHGKHHAGYVAWANAAAEKLEKARKGELEIDVKAILRDLSFNLNGHLLHELFWENMKAPEENNKPAGRVADAIDKNFSSFDAFKKQFSAAAKSVEGSGWAVLASDGEGTLYIVQVEKHNVNHIMGCKPLLALDVWEHAYYLDYLNDRGSYIDKWWGVVNWKDVESRV